MADNVVGDNAGKEAEELVADVELFACQIVTAVQREVRKPTAAIRLAQLRRLVEELEEFVQELRTDGLLTA